MRLFIVGAGASMGTLGLPGVAKFGRTLEKKVPDWRSKFGALSAVIAALEPQHRRSDEDWDLDAAWTHVDYVAKLYGALDVMHFPSSASHGLHAAIAAVYGDIQPELDRVRIAYDARREFTLRSEIDRVGKNDVVVSFNWDTLVESLLVHRLSKGGSLRVIQAPHQRINIDCVQFAKPHGSLTWNRYALDALDDDGGPKLGPVLGPDEILWSEFETDEKLKKDPLLLGAVPMKSELISEVGNPQHQIVMAQWATLLRGISHADEICIMGYGFPREDAYGRFLMRQAVRRRRKRVERIDLYEVPVKFPEVRDAIVEVFGVSPSDVADRGPLSACV